MTTIAWAAAAVAAVAAAANWWSRWREHRPTELWSKPLTLVALVVVAVALTPAHPAVRAWFVAGLVLSLAGDVFLLGGRRWFVPGLAAFLVGHLAYVAGFIAAPAWRWWAVAVAVVVVASLAFTIGRRIVAGATAASATLRWPVTAYLGVISAMVMCAAAAGNGWAVAGAAAFLVSDTVLGWREFVEERPWMPLAVMVSYHLAQAGLVASLL